MRITKLAWALMVLALAVTADAAEGPDGLAGRSSSETPESNYFSRSLVSPGQTARLERVLARARRGEEVTVGVIGGSITQGAGASRPEMLYAGVKAAD